MAHFGLLSTSGGGPGGMFLRRQLIVGISGASCSGKTTLVKLLKETFPWASVVHQDAYYYPNESKYHTYLPDVKHFNWDLKSAVDFPRMEKDLAKVLGKNRKLDGYLDRIDKAKEKLLHFPNDHFVQSHRPADSQVGTLIDRFSSIPLTLIEGHIIFNHSPFYNLCGLRYFLTLEQDELFARRRKRVYDPPNPPGYLEKYVWPAYVSRLEEARKLEGIQYYDASKVELLTMYQEIRQEVTLQMSSLVPESPTVTPSTSEEPAAGRRMAG